VNVVFGENGFFKAKAIEMVDNDVTFWNVVKKSVRLQ